MPIYADIVLPLAQPAYTFAIPDGMSVVEGQAVVVQFGAHKFYTGIVWRIHDRKPDFPRIKSIRKTLYNRPVVPENQRVLWEWIASYYLCTLGEVMRCALPTLIKPSGDSEEELLDDEFQPRTEWYYTLDKELHDADRLNQVFEKMVRRAPNQYKALLEIAGSGDGEQIFTGEIARRLLHTDRCTLYALERKGFIHSEKHERTAESNDARFLLPSLTEHQQQALDALCAQFERGKETALLHGITGSGKTELYIHLIARTLAQGGDVLLLVPEIALTAQLIDRMESIFGSRVTAYHSKLTLQSRAETFLRLGKSDGGEFVVGARSAIFLPLKHLRLVIVDEEHDTSYKQTEPAPRYNARDCAVMMAHLFGGHTLLGSATPALESWTHAKGGKYGIAWLTERYGGAQPPRIFVSDTLRAARRGERHARFNKLLLDKMGEALARHEQIMLFQNRRGFSPYVSCTQCGWTPRCPNCNVTLTYHRASNKLICHYCGYKTEVPQKCPSCRVTDVVPVGFGTEQIEEEIAKIFPEARVARLDRDKATSERAYRAIIDDFAEHRTDILVGTQMISKGFDFGGVSLVGILNADNLLHNPDFRASERAFQMMTQVAGRAGRRSDAGEVVIQTSEPGHPVVQQVAAGSYEKMACQQLSERREFFYPPYARLIVLTLRHTNCALVRHATHELSVRLRERFGRRILGPMPPPVDRVRGEYLVNLMLKIESSASAMRAREILKEVLDEFAKLDLFKKVTVAIDVDPV